MSKILKKCFSGSVPVCPYEALNNICFFKSQDLAGCIPILFYYENKFQLPSFISRYFDSSNEGMSPNFAKIKKEIMLLKVLKNGVHSCL